MKLDIRLPIGILFAIIGLLLVLYGLFSDPALYQQSLGININLWWGAVLLLFGGLMLVPALRITTKPQSHEESQKGNS